MRKISRILRGTAGKANASKLCRGWVAGHMRKGIAGSRSFEVKLWHYNGPIDYGIKTFGGIELIVIYAGRLRFVYRRRKAGSRTRQISLDGSKHEYLIFPKGISKTVVVEQAPAFGVTVRWPSKPGINRVKKVINKQHFDEAGHVPASFFYKIC